MKVLSCLFAAYINFHRFTRCRAALSDVLPEPLCSSH